MLLLAALFGSAHALPALGGTLTVLVEDHEEAELAYEDLIDEYDAQRVAYIDKSRNLAGPELEELNNRRRAQEAQFVQRFIAGAVEFAETDGAIPFLAWLTQNAPNEGAESAARIALETLFDVHVDSKAMASFASSLSRLGFLEEDEMMSYVEQLITNNRHPEVQANAMFSRAVLRKGYGDPPADKRQTILADFKKAAEISPDPTTAARAKRYIFELENLQVGMKAPDIEGKDLDGVPFKLSDYKGKVVVLDFWGDW